MVVGRRADPSRKQTGDIEAHRESARPIQNEGAAESWTQGACPPASAAPPAGAAEGGCGRVVLGGGEGLPPAEDVGRGADLRGRLEALRGAEQGDPQEVGEGLGEGRDRVRQAPGARGLRPREAREVPGGDEEGGPQAPRPGQAPQGGGQDAGAAPRCFASIRIEPFRHRELSHDRHRK